MASSPRAGNFGELSPALLDFVAAELGVVATALTPETDLGTDLGVDGDDGLEFMEAYAERFNVTLTAFQPQLHFGPEAAFNPIAALWSVVRPSRRRVFLPIRLAMLQQAINTGVWVSPSSAAG